MTLPHERLDSYMDDRRVNLDLIWKDVADRAGMSVEALRAIRRGLHQPRKRNTRRLERALHWAPGSIDAILGGGEPMPADPRELELDSEIETLEQVRARRAETERQLQDLIRREAELRARNESETPPR